MHTIRISRIEEGAKVLLLAFPVERYLAVIVQQALRMSAIISYNVAELAKCHRFYHLKRVMAYSVPLYIYVGHHKEDISKILGGVASYKARIDLIKTLVKRVFNLTSYKVITLQSQQLCHTLYIIEPLLLFPFLNAVNITRYLLNPLVQQSPHTAARQIQPYLLAIPQSAPPQPLNHLGCCKLVIVYGITPLGKVYLGVHISEYVYGVR